MKKIISFLLVLSPFISVYATSKIILEGNYQGKNLYVQNPFTSTGVGFCTIEVRINGETTTDEVNSSAFEIDFGNFPKLQLGDKVKVEIFHKDDCKPKVLNPEVLKPRSTFETISIEVTKDGILKWITKNEVGKLPYIIEQFRWNKWVKVGEVDGQGSITSNSYSYKITPHSGANQFRVKQVDATGNPRYSTIAKYRSMAPEVTYKISKTSLIFSAETMYEIYDKYGNIIKKGVGTEADISGLAKGIYYLNYDNKTETFKK